ncbi:MAG: acyl carrier protein [Bacteroidetes bacterium]|jgi:acyl carrier protein|nr:acyl carrier protein [Bacteroidota bacterium]MBT6687737.1 acyl carrier protein [Bacteroidota bacterium]MBT7143371.1 acyl carrier protein [Bacteroidota bacterium]MBT7490693.1 acyl carrier protein [Bacteroidota bacterium]
MSIEEFIEQLEEEFDDLEPGVLKPESEFRKNFEWNSINALIFIALVDSEYDVTINAEDLNSSKTIQDLFEIIKSRV